MPFHSLDEFLIPINAYEISEDEGYETGQIGQLITNNNNLEAANLVLIGCNEWRGGAFTQAKNAANSIRQQLYKLFYWHNEIKIADAGNIKLGETMQDSYAALRTVCKELMQQGKKVLVFGGSHDNTLALYQAFAENRQIIEATVVDALFDLDRLNAHACRRFLIELLTSEPNFVQHFNLIGFQSYFTYPQMLETIDKLRFNCYRVGKAQENMEEVEPVIRSSHLFSLDMNAAAYAFAPANAISPNGFSGQDMCKLMQYAGMSSTTKLSGIFNYTDTKDSNGFSAMQIAQMIWYFIDGMQKQAHELPLGEAAGYVEYHVICAEVDTLFLKSKNTGRWWMQMPDSTFLPCSYVDYLQASQNDFPERWLRAQERM